MSNERQNCGNEIVSLRDKEDAPWQIAGALDTSSGAQLLKLCDLAFYLCIW
jgi:hypothetical protein